MLVLPEYVGDLALRQIFFIKKIDKKNRNDKKKRLGASTDFGLLGQEGMEMYEWSGQVGEWRERERGRVGHVRGECKGPGDLVQCQKRPSTVSKET